MGASGDTHVESCPKCSLSQPWKIFYAEVIHHTLLPSPSPLLWQPANRDFVGWSGCILTVLAPGGGGWLRTSSRVDKRVGVGCTVCVLSVLRDWPAPPCALSSGESR